MMGELLTIWTIRIALLCYAACLAGWLTLHGDRWGIVSRWLWTAGCLFFVIHVACAFHFYHGWSHQAAWLTTAQQTEELIGWRYGDGIYFSYLFLLVWVIDVGWSWTRPGRGSLVRSVWQAFVHAYLFFIAFNGAVVFEDGPIRWAGIIACLVLGLLGVRYVALNSRRSNRGQLQTDNTTLHTVREAP